MIDAEAAQRATSRLRRPLANGKGRGDVSEVKSPDGVTKKIW